jgi:hypothetical protein
MPRSDGYRQQIWAVRRISELVEKNPDLPRPKIELWHGETDVTFYVLDGKKTEELILDVVALFPDVEWAKNDPTGGVYDSSYYTMKGRWQEPGTGPVKLEVIAQRADLCERVVTMSYEVVEEIPDPEQVALIPLVKVPVTKEIVEWQCNKAIAEATV